MTSSESVGTGHQSNRLLPRGWTGARVQYFACLWSFSRISTQAYKV